MNWGERYECNGYYVPPRMMGGLRRYIEHGVPAGSFLMAVVENDLKNAVGRADEENLTNLPAYVYFLYNEAPGGCWGSQEKVERWIGQGGLHGKGINLVPSLSAA